MSDLISRQAAIDALAKMMPKSYTPDGSHPADEEIFREQEIFADCIKTLEILPSAQPEPCEDAVSRKAVYDAMVEKGQRSRRYKLGEIWELNGTEIREALDAMQSAQPDQRWIPCSERLPEVGKDVMVCYDFKGHRSETKMHHLICAFCDNLKCVRGAKQCEFEQWKRQQAESEDKE